MQEVIDFLNENRVGFLATSEDDKPYIRPWGFMFEEAGKFWFLTNNNKRIYKQLQKNPYIEFSSVSPNLASHVRISGKVTFCDDIQVKKMFEITPLLNVFYDSPEDSTLEAFYLEHGKAYLSTKNPDNGDVFEF